MSTIKKQPPKSTKKELRALISKKLETTFGDLKKNVSEKKFGKKIKKASKVLLSVAGNDKKAKKAVSKKS